MAIKAYLTSLKQSAVNYITSTLVGGNKVALDVAVVAGSLTTSNLQMGPDRSYTNIGSTNISNIAWSLLITATARILSLDITNNSGGDYSLRINAIEVAYIPAGYVGKMPVIVEIGQLVEVQSLAGIINAGSLFVNTSRV